MTESIRKTSHVCGSDHHRYRHGHCPNPGGKRTPSPTYTCWYSMRQRCRDPKNKSYSHYGGRGISVCERWIDFVNFLSDMGEQPEGMTIERIDNDAPYSPENCRWATRTEQSRNQTRNIRLTIYGKTLTVAEWAIIAGIDPRTIHARLTGGYGRCLTRWPLRAAVFAPVGMRLSRILTINPLLALEG